MSVTSTEVLSHCGSRVRLTSVVVVIVVLMYRSTFTGSYLANIRNYRHDECFSRSHHPAVMHLDIAVQIGRCWKGGRLGRIDERKIEAARIHGLVRVNRRRQIGNQTSNAGAQLGSNGLVSQLVRHTVDAVNARQSEGIASLKWRR